MADTDGIKLSDLPDLPLPVREGDLIEVIRPRPDRPGQYSTFHAPAAGKQIAHSDEETVGLIRLATVEQTLAGERTDRAVTSRGLADAVAIALAERINGSGELTAVYSEGILTISGPIPPPEFTFSSVIVPTFNRNFSNATWAEELGLFIACVDSFAINIATSPDGLDWVNFTAPGAQYFNAVCWSETLELAIAVAHAVQPDMGAVDGERVSTSPDAATWTPRACPASGWTDVCAADDIGQVCAVANNGTDRVMTTTDGITWVGRTAAQANSWLSVCRSPELGLYVAVANTGTDRVMTSPDGITWTAQTCPSNLWRRVVWADTLGLFVAVGSGTTDYAMTSPDGINWTASSLPAAGWRTLNWCRVGDQGALLAFASGGATQYARSYDGVTWTLHDTPVTGFWFGGGWSDSQQKLLIVNFDASGSGGVDFLLGEIA